MTSPLENVFWNCLAGPHARFATGTGDVRRYGPGFSPIVGARDAANPDFPALAAICAAADPVYIDAWSGPCPAGWEILKEARMFKMVWDARPPGDDPAPDAMLLAPNHASSALQLAQLTNPGPFGIRTPELGEYFGIFEGRRLVAMAGERFQLPGWREISGICTHPDFQGRGLARKLTLKLVRRQALRGERTFLHVMGHNERARHLYREMGFRDELETTVRVIQRRTA